MVKRPRSKLLRISCPDATGLVHKVTGVLYRWECNIVSNHEFVEPETGRFFMRTGFEGEVDGDALREEMSALLPPGAKIDLTDSGKKRIVVLVTREPHCLGELLLRAAHKDLPAEVVAVVGSRPDLRGLSESFGVPFHLAPSADRTHEEHEADIRNRLEKLSPDYVVLAKYMRILSETFVADYAGRIVNIHHSFLPAFTGARPYRQAYKRGVKMIGAFCDVYKDTDVFDPQKYIAGYMLIPNQIPGFGAIAFNEVKISMRVAEHMQQEIRAGKALGLDTFLPEATGNLGGFADACHSLTAATTVSIGKESTLIEEMEKILSK